MEGNGRTLPDGTVLREPKRSDAAAIRQLVRRSGVLEENSLYAYLLLCTHFRATTVVAEREGVLAGFVAAYRPPTHPDTVFVWQIGVAEAARGRGLAREILRELVRRASGEGVRFLESTVTPSNEPSRRLFQSLARSIAAPCATETAFNAADFAGEAHEEEVLFRIGPWEQPGDGNV